MEKRLYRSRDDRMLAGVCAGLAEYFKIDAVMVRVLAIVSLLIFNIMAVIAYLVLAVIVPSASTAGNIHSG